ncbi:hypothetical protein [Nocardia sp. bgisy118]|uniref:hypothetical protein n=1 Tax=Nocardia sp. bgisy118 TaxID=3413786 RepID=UPI003F4A08A6
MVNTALNSVVCNARLATDDIATEVGRLRGAVEGRVCLPWGFAPSGPKVRAVCACGFRTTARANGARALAALLAEHGHTDPVCSVRARPQRAQLVQLPIHHVEILTDPVTGDRFLVSRGMPQSPTSLTQPKVSRWARNSTTGWPNRSSIIQAATVRQLPDR